jgi:hypothetical protein
MADYNLFNNEQEQPSYGLLKKSRGMIQSPGGVLSNTVQPGQGGMLPNAIDAYREKAADLYKQGSDIYSQEPDFSQFQDFAKQRSQQGDAAMLNALAAQFAGEGFALVQDQYMKKAAAARDPMKLGSGLITADGQFLKDPEVAQNKKAEFLLQQAKAYETIAQNADTARERIAAQRSQEAIMNQMKLMGLNIQQQGNDIRAANAAATRAMAEQNNTDKKEKQLGDNTQKLSNKTNEYVNLVAGVRELNNKLGEYIPEGKKIPGVGYGSDMSLLGLDISGAMMGQEGKANRSLVKNVANELLRAASGQAVTLNEYERQTLSNMASGKFGEQDFLNAYKNVILPKVNEAVSNIGGGFSSEVKDRYRDQGGKVDFSKPFVAPERSSNLPKATGKSNAPAGVDAKVWNAMTAQEKALWQN